MARHDGANNALAESIRGGLDRIVSRAHFPSDADYNAFVAAQVATADKVVLPLNELVNLSRIQFRQATEAGAAVVLSLATHEGRKVLLTNAGPGATVDVAALAVGKVDGQPIEEVELSNTSANDYAIQNGSGDTIVPVGRSVIVKSTNGVAQCTILGPGVPFQPTAAAGSMLVRNATGPTYVQPSIPAPLVFKGAGNGEVLRLPLVFPSIIDTVEVSVNAASADFTAAIDTGPGTAATNITGIVGITASTVALTIGTSGGANTGTAGQYLVVTFANVGATVDGFIVSRYRWTGV